jgi:mono/diheme cytochrome c family protein
MKPIVKKVLLGLGAVLALVLLGGGAFAYSLSSAYTESMNQVYDVPLRDVVRSTDPAVLARGEHLSKSLGGCSVAECHAADLAGGKVMVMGPLGTLTAPNITGAGMGAVYSDGELARLIQHGIKKDGRSVTFMPMQEHGWLPDADVDAIISYVRSLPSVSKPNGPMELGLLGKILDRKDAIVLDVARRIDHENKPTPPAPEPTAAYGKFIARTCSGCHGEKLSGGPIPGAPADLPIPSNITPDATGLAGWSYEDFAKLLDTGVRKNGQKLNPFMPLEMLTAMDEIERKALWAYLQSVPAVAFGNR